MAFSAPDEGRADTVAAAVREPGDYVIAGIEQALWDIGGKLPGVPVYRMLGGAVRDTLGNDMDIAVDLHGRVHKAMAWVLMKELEPFHLMFVEELVLMEKAEAFAELRRHATMPIATGEHSFSRWDFRDLLTGGAVDIIQPDLSHAGGIWEVRKIVAMAEAWDVAVAPHCPLGPVALAACLQLDFCTPNAFIQEQSPGAAFVIALNGAEALEKIEAAKAENMKFGNAKTDDAPYDLIFMDI